MKSSAPLCCLFTLALLGCSSSGPSDEQANLSLACEVTKCECRVPKSGWSLRDAPGQAVAWRADGSAYCPPGLSLSRIGN